MPGRSPIIHSDATHPEVQRQLKLLRIISIDLNKVNGRVLRQISWQTLTKKKDITKGYIEISSKTCIRGNLPENGLWDHIYIHGLEFFFFLVEHSWVELVCTKDPL